MQEPKDLPMKQQTLSFPDTETEEDVGEFLALAKVIGRIGKVSKVYNVLSTILAYDTLLNCLMTIAVEGKVTGRGLCEKIGMKESQIGTIQRNLAKWQSYGLVGREEGPRGKWYIAKRELAEGLRQLAAGLQVLRAS